MTTHDSSLDLPEVRARFAESEARLRELTDSTSEIHSMAAQLDATRSSVGDAADRLGAVASNLADLTGTLGAATDAIQQTDPAAILARLTAAEQTQQDLARDLTAIHSLVEGAERQSEIRSTTIEKSLTSIRLLVLAALVVAAIAAVAAFLP